ncbi:immunity protein Imm33 domain-containing protein [Flavobacterium sp.]|uniref:immunity protein Imm33 domain-containing protein n=2 Tax=Flavobacterium sp. TaxID=239 RepID=UPI0040472946
MNIERKELIELCDKFLKNEIDKTELEFFASNAIMSDEIDWEENDKIISETIFEWDNEIINFPINAENIKLLKKRLETDIDELMEHNFWNSHFEKQKEICKKYNSEWKPINEKSKIAISDNLNLEKLNGLRHKTEKGKICWYIWSGEYSENDDFFKPICAEHLLQRNPKIIKYLGLDDGFRFLITESGYEDVWFDKNLLET